MVEDYGAVGPAVMVHKTQVGEKTNSYCLETPLVTHTEAVTVDLEKQAIFDVNMHTCCPYKTATGK